MRRSALFLSALLPLAACDDATRPDPGAAMSAPTRNALALLPPGAALVGMFDVQEAEAAGTLGDALGPFERAGGEAAARMDELQQRAGFDVARDLERVYFATSDDRPLFVVQARMDRDRLIAFLDDQAGLTRSAYRDLPIFTSDDDDRFAVALLNSDLALAGPEAAVRAAADRALDGGASANTDAELGALLGRARYGDAWLVSRAASHHASDFNVETGVLSADFSADGMQVAAVAQPRAGSSADDLAEALEGAVAMARAQALADPDLRDLLDEVDVRERDGLVEVRGALSSAQIQRMHAR